MSVTYPNNNWLTPLQYAEKFHIHVKTIRRLVKLGKLPGKKIGGSIRVYDKEEAQ